MAARRPARKLAAVPAATPTDPIRYDPVMLAIGQARAHLWLLDAIDGGHVNVYTGGVVFDEAEAAEVREWLVGDAIQAIAGALAEAQVEYQKLRTGAPDGGA